MDAIFCIDKNGVYLGSYLGASVTRLTMVKEVQQQPKAPALDATLDAPVEMEEVEVEVPGEEQVEIPAELPEGALCIPAPPEHGSDILTGFAVNGDQAVGGAWNTDARPKPPQALEEKIAQCLVAAGVMNSKQAATFIEAFNA